MPINDFEISTSKTKKYKKYKLNGGDKKMTVASQVKKTLATPPKAPDGQKSQWKLAFLTGK
jgi:hypothetical protein